MNNFSKYIIKSSSVFGFEISSLHFSFGPYIPEYRNNIDAHIYILSNSQMRLWARYKNTLFLWRNYSPVLGNLENFVINFVYGIKKNI